jgi:SanA protein
VTDHRPRWHRLALVLLASMLLATAADLAVVLSTRDSVTDVARSPHAQVAIVPGARVHPDGRLSPMVADRVDQAGALYRAGAVDRILVSGDHGSWSYDEPGAMRDELLARGVPPQHVFTDHAGFDTWSSMRRAAEVFGVRSAIVVTQEFHLPRALFLARAAGLQAHGVAADLRPYGRPGLAAALREAPARVKGLASVALRLPVPLGPPVPITGDGRDSWGPSGP